MSADELTNLLPPERQRLLTREYYFHLGVVVMVMISILLLIAATLLTPTYVFLVRNASAKEARLASMRAASSSVEDKAFSARLAAISKETATLTALAKLPSASGVVRSVLDVSRPGVTISSITYTPLVAKKPSTLTITGRALTRDALRNYQLALQSASFARSATLPVSAYAKDVDIAFTITILLAL